MSKLKLNPEISMNMVGFNKSTNKRDALVIKILDFTDDVEHPGFDVEFYRYGEAQNDLFTTFEVDIVNENNKNNTFKRAKDYVLENFN